MADNVTESVVVFTLKIRKPGARAKVNTSEIRVQAKHGNGDDAEESSLNVSKELIRHPIYKEIGSLDSALRSFVRSQSLPTRLAGGQHLLPLGLVERVDARVLAEVERRVALVAKLCDEYEAIKADAEERLGDLYDERDFPSVAAFRDAFDVQTRIGAMSEVGANLSKVSEGLYRRELEKAEAARKALVAEITDGIRLAFYELVAGLTESLAPREDGQRKRILATGFDKLKAFVEDFSRLNVTRDGELDSLVGQARAILADPRAGVDAVRASTRAREAVRANLEGLRANLDRLTTSDGGTLRFSYLASDEDAVTSEPSTEAATREQAARDGAAIMGARLAKVEESGPGAEVAPLASPSSGGRLAGIDLQDNAPAVPLGATESALKRFANID